MQYSFPAQQIFQKAFLETSMISFFTATLSSGRYALALGFNDFWLRLKETAERDSLILMTTGFLLLAALLLRYVPEERGRIRAATWLYGAALFFILISALIDSIGATAVPDSIGMSTVTRVIHWIALLIGGIAIVNLAGIFLFDVLLRALKLSTPRILRDLIIAFGYVGIGLVLLSREGASLSGLITTSAVLTAVIGFSLQDTLGNVMGGLALQLEKSINVGDWIRLDHIEGRVREIRWRHTSIETRNWDTMIIPNSVLMKGQVLILGRRDGRSVPHRMWIYFNVDFRYAPTDVISAVDRALQAEPIAGVAEDPRPHCILFDFKESFALYAVRYWLTDLAADDPTNSIVRARIFFALKRADIPLSIPAHSLFLTEESEERKVIKHERQIEHILREFQEVELFHSLTQSEQRTLAERMRPVPFTRGEALTRQGAEAHWLYILTKGSAEVVISTEDGASRRVAILKDGDFFGEMGLMTGEPRTATVIALEDVEACRLDKHDFHDIIHSRPEIAEHISHVLARRKVELEAVREGLDEEAKHKKMAPMQKDILARIIEFFGLKRSEER
ncbi:MAG: cyclic nucleotide-binding domain-containing protein, partial [Acidobacteriota bacterium]